MTTTPFIDTVDTSSRIALTAAASAPFLSPRPTQRPAAMAAASVTRTSPSARFRSDPVTSGMPGSYPARVTAHSHRISSQHDDADLGCLHARPHRGPLAKREL